MPNLFRNKCRIGQLDHIRALLLSFSDFCGNFIDLSIQFVKSLQARDRVIPVVGNFSGTKALAGIGRVMTERGEPLTAFYTSNVEFYLDREGSYPRFISNLSHIPHTSRTVIIRSIFNRGMGGSMSVVQPVDELLSQFAVAR